MTDTLADTLRRHDRDRFQLALFAPSARRPAIMALYAFNYEVARIREVASEPMLGQIRLQWWRDALAEIYAGASPHRHEVVTPLAEAIRAQDLSRVHFDAILDAREADILDQRPADAASLETYAEETSSRLIFLALEILGAPAPEAARAVGIAHALAGLLAAVPFHARMKRCYLPDDRVAALGLDVDRTLFELKPSPPLAQIAREIVGRARQTLDEAGPLLGAAPRAALPALLPAVLARRRLKRIERVNYNLFDPRLSVPDGTQSLRLLWAATRGRV